VSDRLRVFSGYPGFATFNNVSNISWRSVLLVEETGVAAIKTMPAPPAEPAATGNMSCPFPVSVKHIINESEQLSCLVKIECFINY
jgi:hypothetical protein